METVLLDGIRVKSVEANRILTEMRQLENQAKDLSIEQKSGTSSSFAEMLNDAVHEAVQVTNTLQQQADHIKTEYDYGDGSIPISEVFVASEKANLSYQALLQIRNKLLSAYKEIENIST